MYNRSARFIKLNCRTPVGVGPATYYLTEVFGNGVKENANPFNSTQIRKSAFDNKSLRTNPSPNKYKICFRKNRIVGGTTIQNRASRFKYKVARSLKLYPEKEPKKLAGKLHVGVPPRGDGPSVATIPEKGVHGYDITDHGLVKLFSPRENKPIGPMTYYNPEGQQNNTAPKYKGNYWSMRSDRRFRHKETEGPSPAEYCLDHPAETPWQQYQRLLQNRNQADSPLLRSNDQLMRKLCREDLPGPASYFPFDPNTKKCECGKQGTFSKSERKGLLKASEGPGPADYTNSSTTINRLQAMSSVKQSPFNVDADRFTHTDTSPLPGPGEYSPQNDLWHDVKKKGHSKYAQGIAPFDSSAPRNMSMTKPDVLCIPGPDFYYPEKRCCDRSMSSMFASRTCRHPKLQHLKTAEPSSYSTMESFKMITNPKSHLKTSKLAFLTSAQRLDQLKMSSSPGPNTYKLKFSSLNTKGGSIGLDNRKEIEVVTPGPPDYKIHSRYAQSSVLYTHNFTLRPPVIMPSKIQRIDQPKRLYSQKRYST